MVCEPIWFIEIQKNRSNHFKSEKGKIIVHVQIKIESQVRKMTVNATRIHSHKLLVFLVYRDVTKSELGDIFTNGLHHAPIHIFNFP